MSDCECAVQYEIVQMNLINYQNKGGKTECVLVRTNHLISALLLSGIQFRLPTACNVERTQEPTPGKNFLFVVRLVSQ